MKTENKRKHLEMIQAIIARMGGNLFYLRGWSVTLIGAVLAILSQSEDIGIFPIIILLATTLMLWIYDGYFLALERKYRDLYDKVRKLSEEEVDFSMNIGEFNEIKKNTVVYCMFSQTIMPFYLLFCLGGIYLLIRILLS